MHLFVIMNFFHVNCSDLEFAGKGKTGNMEVVSLLMYMFVNIVLHCHGFRITTVINCKVFWYAARALMGVLVLYVCYAIAYTELWMTVYVSLRVWTHSYTVEPPIVDPPR